MTRLEKALWYVETRLSDETLTVEGVAEAVGISKFHLSRLFSAALGRPPVQYIRARRLSNAALSLASGDCKVIDAALRNGFGSHEGFTRAFRAEFGVTPDFVRESRNADDLSLVLADVRSAMDVQIELSRPVERAAGAMTVCGLDERYSGLHGDSIRGIPLQWVALGAHWGHIPGAVNDVGLGVNHDFDLDGAFSYLAGVEVTAGLETTRPLSVLRLAPASYAVYRFEGHISQLPAFMTAIWNDWGGTGHEIADFSSFERYGAEFDPTLGEGVIEVWIPSR